MDVDIVVYEFEAACLLTVVLSQQLSISSQFKQLIYIMM